MANLLITNSLQNNEKIVYKEEGKPEITIPEIDQNSRLVTIEKNHSANLHYQLGSVDTKTWSVCFKDQPYCLEMVDILKGTEPHHTLFRLFPHTLSNIVNDCEIKAQMGGINQAVPLSEKVTVNIFNKLPQPCNVFTTINKNLTLTGIISPQNTNPDRLSLCFDKRYIIEVYFTLDNSSRFAVSITINKAPFIVRKYKMNETAFKLTHAEIQPQDINLTIEPDGN